jgi:hypothetical protein
VEAGEKEGGRVEGGEAGYLNLRYAFVSKET